jgi:putative inorganic carbon (hco3(-)) transporter
MSTSAHLGTPRGPGATKPVGAPGRAKTVAPGDLTGLYALRWRDIWAQLKREHLSFWMICCYLFVEYVRPQSIMPSLDVLPWAKVFLLLSTVTLLADKQRKWVSDPANRWITLFFLAIIASSFNAVYPQMSWMHFMDFFGWFVIYFLIINIVTTEARFLIFLMLFLACSYKLSFFGARTWTMRGFAFTTWGLQGPPGYFQNSGEFAIQMLMFAPIGYEVALFARPFVSRFKYWCLMSMPLTAAMSIMGASSRGGQVAMVYEVYGSMLKGRLNFKTLLAVALVFYAGFQLLPEEQKARFSSAGDDGTSKQRLLYWQHGMTMIEDNPLLGIGYFNFPRYFAVHYPQDMLRGPAFTAEGIVTSELPHNIFIQIGTDTGVTGLVIFGMLIFRTWRIQREIVILAKAHNDTQKPFAPFAKGLTVAMWGFIIAGQFVTVTYYPFFWINLAFMVSLRNVARKHYLALDAAQPSQPPESKRPGRSLVAKPTAPRPYPAPTRATP